MYDEIQIQIHKKLSLCEFKSVIGNWAVGGFNQNKPKTNSTLYSLIKLKTDLDFKDW